MKRRPGGHARNVLPTAEELNDHSIDGPYAERHFLGKSLTEAQAMFAENSLSYLEDLSHMPPRGFEFYFPAAVAYFLSPESSEDFIAVSSFLGSLTIRLDDHANDLLPTTVQPLIDALAAIRDDWGRWFQPDDPETTPWKQCQRTARQQAKGWAELLNLIDRLQAIKQAKGRPKPDPPRL